MTTTITPPTQGIYTTEAQGTGDTVSVGGTIRSSDLTSTIMGATPRLNVVARDSYTGQLIQLTGIKVKMTFGTTVSGIDSKGTYTLVCPNYEAFKKRRVDLMELVPVAVAPVIQNSALPSPVKVRDTLGTFGSTPSPICKAIKENEEEAMKRLGIIHNRTDLQVVQGKHDGRSPGLAISQTTGYVSMFDSSGKQHMTMDGQRLQVQASEIDTGSSMEGRSFGGFPAYKNPVNDYVPQGTIVAPQPRLIPNVVKFASIVLTIVDIVDFVTACKDAVELILSTSAGSSERRYGEWELFSEARYNEWETDIYEERSNA